MKIKEVCARTGLTERTIRFYAEEGLIHPHTSLVNGREYREYSERDVAELVTIADLRKLFFSIEEIRRMKQRPEKIPEVLETYRTTISADVQAKSAIIEALNRLDTSRLHSIDSLAGSLKNLSANLPLPKRDITPPDFGRFDEETKEEREREYELFLKRQARRFKTGRIIVYAIAGLNVANALLSAFIHLNLISLLIQIAISIALVAGVTWVRYVFAIGAALNVILTLMLLADLETANMTGGLAVAIVLQMAYSITACVLLLKSSAVSDFLYAQKNG